MISLSLFAAFYLEQVFPNDFGVQLPWNFLFTRSFWRETLQDVSWAKGCFSVEDNEEPIDDQDQFIADKYEPVSSAVKSRGGVHIRNISKIFPTAAEPFVAVDSVSLDLYEGQVFCLLGHNGAGKTTLISMLIGLLSATSGTAEAYGLSIRKQMSHIRKNLGFCPQLFVLR